MGFGSAIFGTVLVDVDNDVGFGVFSNDEMRLLTTGGGFDGGRIT